MPEISIVIPVYGKYNFTRSCLNDLCKLDLNKNEIIIIDNASLDDTQEKIKEFDGKIKYIRNEKNEFFAKATNKGYSVSSGNYVIFLNNDIRVKSSFDNWTDILADSLRLSHNTIIGPTGGFVDERTGQFKYETSDPSKRINYISGWCVAATRQTWAKFKLPNHIGPFSEEFVHYFEDSDLGRRSASLGVDLKLVDIPLVHFGRVSSGAETGRLFSNAQKIFMKKWIK